jgi:hypothetical protein
VLQTTNSACAGGESRSGTKIPRPHGRTGSIPVSGTITIARDAPLSDDVAISDFQFIGTHREYDKVDATTVELDEAERFPIPAPAATAFAFITRATRSSPRNT